MRKRNTLEMETLRRLYIRELNRYFLLVKPPFLEMKSDVLKSLIWDS